VSISGVCVTTAALVLCGKVDERETGEMGSVEEEGGRPVAVRIGGEIGGAFGIFGGVVVDVG
jgi:hypothetical protein